MTYFKMLYTKNGLPYQIKTDSFKKMVLMNGITEEVVVPATEMGVEFFIPLNITPLIGYEINVSNSWYKTLLIHRLNPTYLNTVDNLMKLKSIYQNMCNGHAATIQYLQKIAIKAPVYIQKQIQLFAPMNDINLIEQFHLLKFISCFSGLVIFYNKLAGRYEYKLANIYFDMKNDNIELYDTLCNSLFAKEICNLITNEQHSFSALQKITTDGVLQSILSDIAYETYKKEFDQQLRDWEISFEKFKKEIDGHINIKFTNYKNGDIYYDIQIFQQIMGQLHKIFL